jgi:hypothetical protein
VVGLSVLCFVYGWVGAAVAWFQGAGPLRALLLAGGWATITVVATLVFLDRRGSRRGATLRAVGLVHASALVAVSAAVLAWPLIRTADWGEPGDRVVSDDGRYAVVTYEWSAMVDPGWNIAVERPDGSGRQWIWRGTEHPVPTEVRFAGPTSIEVVDDTGAVWSVDFDPDSLEPSDRYCTNVAYCYQWPWDGYTRTAPR